VLSEARWNVDKAWFFQQMEGQGKSLRDVAKLMEMDPSALSRALDGIRAIKAPEVRRLAEALCLPEADVLAHVGRPNNAKAKGSTAGASVADRVGAELSERLPGLMEEQVGFKAELENENDPYVVPPQGADPLFGCIAGTLTLLPDVDYTAPADPDWGKAYDD